MKIAMKNRFHSVPDSGIFIFIAIFIFIVCFP